MGFFDLPEHKQRCIELMVIGDPEHPFKKIKYKDIADMLGVSEFTIRRWRADPRFQEGRKEFISQYVKSDIVDEAVRTLLRSMRTKDSVEAAKVGLQFAGELVERRAVEANVNNHTQIDVRSTSDSALLDKINQLQKQLGIEGDPTKQIYIGVGDVVEAEYEDKNNDE